MEIAKEAVRVVQATIAEQRRRRVGVVDHVGDFEERLGAVLVGGRDFAEVGDQVFEELAPSC